MARVDEPHQCIGPAVRFVHRVPQHPVVAPAVCSAEGVHRHHFDEVDAEIHQIVQLLDRRIESRTCSERADVQFVDHPALDRGARPVVVGPCAGIRPPERRTGMHAVGLTRRTRIRQHRRVVVENEPVARTRFAASTSARHQPSSARVISCSVPSTSTRTRSGMGAHTANSAIGALQKRHRQFREQLGGQDRPLNRPPEMRSVHCPARQHRAVSPQPVSDSSTVCRLTAVSTSSPRRNATRWSAAGPSARIGV